MGCAPPAAAAAVAAGGGAETAARMAFPSPPTPVPPGTAFGLLVDAGAATGPEALANRAATEPVSAGPLAAAELAGVPFGAPPAFLAADAAADGTSAVGFRPLPAARPLLPPPPPPPAATRGEEPLATLLAMLPVEPRRLRPSEPALAALMCRVTAAGVSPGRPSSGRSASGVQVMSSGAGSASAAGADWNALQANAVLVGPLVPLVAMTPPRALRSLAMTTGWWWWWALAWGTGEPLRARRCGCSGWWWCAPSPPFAPPLRFLPPPPPPPGAALLAWWWW